jgi:hypothetical protein
VMRAAVITAIDQHVADAPLVHLSECDLFGIGLGREATVLRDNASWDNCGRRDRPDFIHRLGALEAALRGNRQLLMKRPRSWPAHRPGSSFESD